MARYLLTFRMYASKFGMLALSSTLYTQTQTQTHTQIQNKNVSVSIRKAKIHSFQISHWTRSPQNTLSVPSTKSPLTHSLYSSDWRHSQSKLRPKDQEHGVGQCEEEGSWRVKEKIRLTEDHVDVCGSRGRDEEESKWRERWERVSVRLALHRKDR